jgi:Zn-finger nucleic acid-binding protein
MQCPACKVDLVMADRQGVEVDYCPKCRGVWLDRGELDKILERTMAEAGPAMDPDPRDDRRDRGRRDDRDRDRDDDDYYRGRRRKSILSEILDF